MTPSEAPLALLKHFERGPHGGFAPCVYRDLAGHETIGWNKATNPKTGKKEPLAGLTRRREAERELFLRDGVPG